MKTMTTTTRRWVLLAYRVPREPSTPRISVWRRLKKLGILQLVDGLVALPFDERNREQLEWTAEDIVERGGEAFVWIARPATHGEDAEFERRMSTQVTSEYEEVVREARAALSEGGDGRGLGRLRRRLDAIRRHDYFEAPGRDKAERAVAALAKRVAERAA